MTDRIDKVLGELSFGILEPTVRDHAILRAFAAEYVEDCAGKVEGREKHISVLPCSCPGCLPYRLAARELHTYAEEIRHAESA